MNDSQSEFRPVTQRWSDHYEIIHNAVVRTNSGEEALIDPEMYDALVYEFGRPLIGFIEGRHYQFKPRRVVPVGSVAVPEDQHGDPDALLIQT
jgi:hypothetical protein